METTLESFRDLNDDQLLAEVRLLVSRERMATTVLVASLSEVDARQLYLSMGYSSLFTYCTSELHLSERAAYSRIRAARVARRFPVVLEYLAEGSLTLTNLTILAPNLTDRNHRTLLDAAKYKTRPEVERQMAALHPDEPDLITLRVRVRRETHDKLRRAQDLLRHVLPDGDVAEVLDRAFTVLVRDLEKKKLANVNRPRPARMTASRSRHIPATVRRSVRRRDDDRCAFIGTQGRCRETGLLEFHHVVPYAAGGPSTVANIQLRCRAHNQYEADRQAGEPARERPPADSSHPPDSG